MSDRLKAYASLTRIDRPIGALLLLWPTLWALWLAGEGRPAAKHIVIFVAGTFLMRSAGCAINDFADRKYDGAVERTKARPLATGAIASWEAPALAAVLAVLAFVLVLQTNRLTVLLSFAGVVIAAVYPYFKRFTHLPQAWLGIAFSWGIPMAFAAETGGLPWECWVLLAANLLWVVAYDTVYAMVDRDDDLRIGVKSTAILFGELDRWVVLGCHSIAILILLALGVAKNLGSWYLFGLAIATAFASYEALLYFSRDRDACFRAFLHGNWFGVAVFAAFVLAYLR